MKRASGAEGSGSEAVRGRAQARREDVLALHGVDRLVRDVDALYRELRAQRAPEAA